MTSADAANPANAAAMLAQMGTPSRNRKPDATCPIALIAKTTALSTLAVPSATFVEVSSDGRANARENIKDAYAKKAKASIKQVGSQKMRMMSLEKVAVDSAGGALGKRGAEMASTRQHPPVSTAVATQRFRHPIMGSNGPKSIMSIMPAGI